VTGIVVNKSTPLGVKIISSLAKKSCQYSKGLLRLKGQNYWLLELDISGLFVPDTFSSNGSKKTEFS